MFAFLLFAAVATPAAADTQPQPDVPTLRVMFKTTMLRACLTRQMTAQKLPTGISEKALRTAIVPALLGCNDEVKGVRDASLAAAKPGLIGAGMANPTPAQIEDAGRVMSEVKIVEACTEAMDLFRL